MTAQKALNLPSFEVPLNHRHGFLYVLVFEGDIVKIGRSGDPKTRVAQHISTSSLLLIEGYLFAVYDSVSAERNLLAWYDNFSINGGEWFKIPEADRDDLRKQGVKIDIGGMFLWPYCATMSECHLCKALWELQ